MYLAYCAGVIAHNHNHSPTFTRRRPNTVFSMWISLFYGHPVFAWIPTHNQNHHRFTESPRRRVDDRLARDAQERPRRRGHLLLRGRGRAGAPHGALRRAGATLEPPRLSGLRGPVRLRLRRTRCGVRARDRALRRDPRRVGLRVGARHPGAGRALGPHVHQLRAARRLRPVVALEPLARLHLALDERARLRQRLPHGSPRGAGPALE